MLPLDPDMEVAESRAFRVMMTRMAYFLYGEADVRAPSPIMPTLIVISRRSPTL